TSDQSVASLLTAMLQMSRDSVGCVPSHLETDQGGISFCVDEFETGTICALFHDLSVPEDLGHILASEMLHLFIEDNRTVLVNTGRPSMSSTYVFPDRRIAQTVRNSMTTLLDNLQDEPGIRICGLSNQDSCDPFFTRIAVDQHAFDANITGVIESAAFLLGKLCDGLDNISMSMGVSTAHCTKVDEEQWFVVVADNVLSNISSVRQTADVLKKGM
ncbi:hypothetical protein, variant, partial [Sphaeroforma arctica JP610]